MLYILCVHTSNQIRLLQEATAKVNTKCRVLELMHEEVSVSFSDEEIYLNSQRITDDDRFYSDINPEFPFIPSAADDGNRRYFSDSYISRQQKMSQAFSVLTILSRRGQMLNDFERLNTLYTQIDVLHRLEQTGLDVVDYCATDTLSYLEQSPLHEENYLLWSSVEHLSPLKRIETSTTSELLTADNNQPYIFRKNTPGVPVRVWLLNGDPVLAALIEMPGGTGEKLQLEQYHYISDLDFFKSDARRIHDVFKLDFVEIFGKVNPENHQLVIYGLDPQPVITELETTGRIWLAEKIVTTMCGIPFSEDAPQDGARPTVYLKKMLQPLIER